MVVQKTKNEIEIINSAGTQENIIDTNNKNDNNISNEIHQVKGMTEKEY